MKAMFFLFALLCLFSQISSVEASEPVRIVLPATVVIVDTEETGTRIQDDMQGSETQELFSDALSFCQDIRANQMSSANGYTKARFSRSCRHLSRIDNDLRSCSQGSPNRYFRRSLSKFRKHLSKAVAQYGSNATSEFLNTVDQLKNKVVSIEASCAVAGVVDATEITGMVDGNPSDVPQGQSFHNPSAGRHREVGLQ